MLEATYEVRKRRWPSSFPPLQRPWELLKDGKPVGFYETERKANAVHEATLAAVGSPGRRR